MGECLNCGAPGGWRYCSDGCEHAATCSGDNCADCDRTDNQTRTPMREDGMQIESPATARHLDAMAAAGSLEEATGHLLAAYTAGTPADQEAIAAAARVTVAARRGRQAEES